MDGSPPTSRAPKQGVRQGQQRAEWYGVDIPITEQGYHNLMSLYSLGVWLRHKLVIFGYKLTVLQNLIKSVTDINNIRASQLFSIGLL